MHVILRSKAEPRKLGILFRTVAGRLGIPCNPAYIDKDNPGGIYQNAREPTQCSESGTGGVL